MKKVLVFDYVTARSWSYDGAADQQEALELAKTNHWPLNSNQPQIIKEDSEAFYVRIWTR